MYVGITCLIFGVCVKYINPSSRPKLLLSIMLRKPNFSVKSATNEALCRFPKGTYQPIHVLPPSELFPLFFYPMESTFRWKSWLRRGSMLRSGKDTKLDPCCLAVLFSAHFQITSPTTDVLFLPSSKNETGRFPWPFRTCFFPNLHRRAG